ncbi:class I SAM-dependent methyltransferase [Hymenobacter radiodurans]|uniref:hypothetical protein n=1 Tax=Hymenobacter radiodurans TaxID=2496028 RepID=UPI0029391103|nr:hypothetical protein [Hymenobacter radiodurans]
MQTRPGARILAHTADIYATPELLPHAEDIQTHYERRFRGEGIAIKYIQFTLS